MKEDCEAQDKAISWWLEALIPSFPPTLTAAVGFYVFHKLAMRRQKREEIRQICDKFKVSSQELAGACCDAWEKTGKEAIIGGDIVKYKGKIFIADNNFQSLISYSSRFDMLRSAYSDLKRTGDERHIEEIRTSIEDKKRAADPSYSTVIRKKLALLLRKVDECFVDGF